MESEGISKACTIKVMTKTAITTVTSKDCRELRVSVCAGFSITAAVPGSFVPGFSAPGSSAPGSLHALIAAAFGPSVRLCGRSAKIFKHLAGGILLRILLCGTIGPAHELGFAVGIQRLQSRFDRERLAVFRAALLHQHIRWLESSAGLQFFL